MLGKSNAAAFHVRPPLERALNYAKKQIALEFVQGEALS
jgi:hypothetical protein